VAAGSWRGHDEDLEQPRSGTFQWI